MPARRLAAMIDLRSDTFTRPTPAMRRAMAEAEVGDDVWGEDPTIQRLEAAVAERLGHEAALFVPSGTMGNQICLRLAAPPGTECLANEDNHILWYEAAAAPVLSGVQLHPVPGLGGVADEAGLHLHCDGARIWNASVATGVPLERYGRLFDSLSVCFSKGLGAPVGSAVVGRRDLVEEAREVRHLYGGAMRQAGVLAADTDPGRVRLVFSYEVSAEDAERAAKAVAVAAG